MAKIEEAGSKEMQEKEEILKNNNMLLSLYINLVKGKLISPRDFWSLHYNPVILIFLID